MSKRKSRRSRVIHNNTNRRLHASLLSSLLDTPVSRTILRSGLTEYEDMRTFSPVPRRTARTFSGAPHALQISRPLRSPFSPAVQFVRPDRMVICRRRKTRREVIFARGRGGRGFKKPRRNYFSDVRC